MKKVIFSALTFLMLSTVAVFAQDAGQTSPAIEDQDQTATDIAQEQRTEVSLQELPEELPGCSLVAPGLHQDVEHVAVLIDRPPQIVPFAVDIEKDFIEVPCVARPTTPG
jgi:hypothetical protein